MDSDSGLRVTDLLIHGIKRLFSHGGTPWHGMGVDVEGTAQALCSPLLLDHVLRIRGALSQDCQNPELYSQAAANWVRFVEPQIVCAAHCHWQQPPAVWPRVYYLGKNDTCLVWAPPAPLFWAQRRTFLIFQCRSDLSESLACQFKAAATSTQ